MRKLLLILLIAGCQRTPGTPPPRRITVVTTQEPDALLPQFSESIAANQVVEAGTRYLTQYDRDWRMVPGVAESIPSLGEGGGVILLDAAGAVTTDPDRAAKMVVNWHLRRDVRWADGQRLVARDFVLGHQVVMDPSQEVRDRSLAEKIEDIRATDDATLRVTWKEPFAFFTAFRNHVPLPAHVVEAFWVGDGGARGALKKSPWLRRPLYYGPFALGEWRPGEWIRLVRNPVAFAPPRVDEVVWRFAGSDRAALSLLEAGEADAIAPDGSIGVDLAEELRARRGGDFVVDLAPGMVWAHIDFNCEDEWLRDARLRRALASAIDRRSVVDRVFHGRYATVDTLFPPRHEGNPAQPEPIRYDPQAARAELDALGYPVGAGGLRHDAKGRVLSLELAYATGVKAAEDALTAFQAQWRAVGVEVRLVGSPARVFFGDVLKQRKSPHLAFYAFTMDPMAYGETFLSSRHIPSEANRWTGQNQAAWRNAEVDALMDAVPRTLDAARRRDLLRHAAEIFRRELPMLPVYTRPVVSARRKDLLGWAPTGTHTTVSWNIESWEVRATRP
ncbi:MAG: peptide ABC transporter substrate-binding protein [Deltaproteobacteria bacterium]|nr:peptide ABC transporter substrate-binding protein [Deltaproteobacteria bacterium]